MQFSRFIASAGAAGSLLIAGNAFAAIGPFHAEAKLAGAPAASSVLVIADANWRCDGDACIGDAAHRASLDNPVRECRKVAAVLGPLAAYTTQGVKLQGGDLKACNTAAAKSTVAASAK
jgi:hypothetical protein